MPFWDLHGHYFVNDHPPVIIDKMTGKLVRHRGGSGRCAFWAGYDGLITPIYPRTGDSAVASAYRGGAAYRRSSRPDLPEPTAGLHRR